MCGNSSPTKLELKLGYNFQFRIPFHNIMYRSFLFFCVLVSVPKINICLARVQRSSWCSLKMFVFLMFYGARTSPNGTKCSTKLRGTSVGEVNEFSPYSIWLTLGYSVFMPCASSGHIGFNPKWKNHFDSCNLERLRLDQRESKILRDLQEVQGLECLVTMPTRVTDTTEFLLDVTLTSTNHNTVRRVAFIIQK